MKETFIKKEWPEENVIIFLHFQGGYAVRQMEINGNHVERVTLDNPIKENIVLCDAFLSDLELSETDFITKEEFERAWIKGAGL